MSYRKLELIRNIEHDIQQLWKERKVFEAEVSTDETSTKSFITFPYPYMNGKLHLGHAFSLSKCEFKARFDRICGINVLFPFAFHCTGMPIVASADKIKQELQDGRYLQAIGNSNEHNNINGIEEHIEAKKMKSKVAAKTGLAKTQTEILLSLNIPSTEIPQFANPEYWIKYFPLIAIDDLNDFGVGVDWRRKFVTTNINQYYDRFIKWQYITLNKRGYIKYDLRPTVFNISTNQPCADHDRATGEGVTPVHTKLAILKLLDGKLRNKIINMIEKKLLPTTLDINVLTVFDYSNSDISNKQAFYVYSGSNISVYVGFRERVSLGSNNVIGIDSTTTVVRRTADLLFSDIDTIYICNYQTAKNLAFQGRIPFNIEANDVISLLNLNFADFIDEKLYFEHNPAVYYTGVETKQEKNGISTGIIIPQIKKKVIEIASNSNSNLYKHITFDYYAAEKVVMSRSNEECVVALCNQWYCDYGNEKWTKQVLDYVSDASKFNAFGATTAFTKAIQWLDGWACSRSYGLGTYIPWEEERGNLVLIESLSDSTIYFAYYTIAHMLQGDLYGSKPGLLNIQPDELTYDVFDYIYCQTDNAPSCTIDISKLNCLRDTFKYWYPMTVRCSGKDLINNHLTMSLFHHAAIWNNNPEFWPKSIYTNGLLLLDSQKMSKQTGNFLSLNEAIQKYSADATRIALAEAGDSCDDANFDQSTALSALMKIYKLVLYVDEFKSMHNLRYENKTEIDNIFEAEILRTTLKSIESYERMVFRDALKYSIYALTHLRELYKSYIPIGKEMNKDSLLLWFKAICFTLHPIAPHSTEYIWRSLEISNNLLTNSRYTDYLKLNSIDYLCCVKHYLVTNFIAKAKLHIDKAHKNKKNIDTPDIKIIAKLSENYDDYKLIALNLLNSYAHLIDTASKSNKIVLDLIKKDEELCIAIKNNINISSIISFASFKLHEYYEISSYAFLQKLPFSEKELYQNFKHYFVKVLGYEINFVYENNNKDIFPGSPLFEFDNA